MYLAHDVLLQFTRQRYPAINTERLPAVCLLVLTIQENQHGWTSHQSPIVKSLPLVYEM
jgi:hypothetical protein